MSGLVTKVLAQLEKLEPTTDAPKKTDVATTNTKKEITVQVESKPVIGINAFICIFKSQSNAWQFHLNLLPFQLCQRPLLLSQLLLCLVLLHLQI